MAGSGYSLEIVQSVVLKQRDFSVRKVWNSYHHPGIFS